MSTSCATTSVGPKKGYTPTPTTTTTTTTTTKYNSKTGTYTTTVKKPSKPLTPQQKMIAGVVVGVIAFLIILAIIYCQIKKC
jgi:hypothetical protein